MYLVYVHRNDIYSLSSSVMFEMKSMSIGNDKVNYDEIII